MPIYKSNLYEQLNIDLKSTLKNMSVEEYLFDLRPKASDLYIDLSSPSVNVDYSDHDIQIAYMLRYLPGYWEQIYTSLIEITNRSQWPKSKAELEFNSHRWRSDPLKNFKEPIIRGEMHASKIVETPKQDPKNQKEDFNIALFCCGPAPEIIGIVKFFEEMDDLKSRYQNINIHLFDLKIDSWGFARNTFVLNKDAMERLTSQNFQFFEHQLDITERNLNLDLKFGKQAFHICHFQNCMNEIYHTTTQERLMANIYSISRLLINTGFFIMTDRNTVSSAKEACNFISDSLSSNSYYEAAPLITGSYFYDTHSPITEIMRTLFWQSWDYKDNEQRLIPTLRNQRFIRLIRKNLN
jgi:hypothetical protein